MPEHKKFVVIACTGMGKILASVGRVAAFLAQERDPNKFILGNLPAIAAGIENAKSEIEGKDIITLTGCKEKCPEKILRRFSIPILADIMISEVYRENKTLKPKSRSDIGNTGLQLAEKIVEKLQKIIIIQKEEKCD